MTYYHLCLNLRILLFFPSPDSVFSDRQSSTPVNMAAVTQPPEVPDSACSLSPRNAATPSKSPTPDKVIAESKGHPERKRRASNESEDVSTKVVYCTNQFITQVYLYF